MKNHLHKAAGILISIASAASCICFIVGCIMIYLSGDVPFSRQSVAETFSYIQIPVYISLILIAVGFFLSLFTSEEKAKKKITTDEGMTLEIKRRTNDISAASPALLKKIKSAKALRFISNALLFIVLVAELIIYVILINKTGILQRGGAESTAVTQNTVDALLWLLPFVACALGITILHSYLNSHLIKKETALLSTLPHIKDRAKVEKTLADANDNGEISTNIVRIAIFCAALVLAVYGFIAGGYVDVLAKAVAICTECIGLG